MKILPQMYRWTRKSDQIFGSHRDSDGESGSGLRIDGRDTRSPSAVVDTS